MFQPYPDPAHFALDDTNPAPLSAATPFPQNNLQAQTAPPPFGSVLASTRLSSTMANIPVLPYQFVPGEMNIQQDPACRLQRNVVVVDDPPLDHAQFALVMVVPPPSDLQGEAILAEVRHVLHDDHGAPTLEGEIYPFCVGLVRFQDRLVRDAMVDLGEQTLDEHSNFYLLRHDEGPNMRRPII